MAEIALQAGNGGPGTHALVIGVSHYPYLAGPEQSEQGKRFGLENLSTGARSAADVARWLLFEHRNERAPLASLRVLLSPIEGEVIDEEVASRLPGPCPATRAAVEAEFLALKAACQGHPENNAFVYIAGHGIQITKLGAIVLLHDFAAPEHARLLDGAIDMLGCHGAFNGDGFASYQAWLVDACRARPTVAAKFETLTGALTFDEPLGQVESSPLYLAASSRELAWGAPGGTTLFSTALLAALRGKAAKGPDGVCDDWHVSVSRLGEHLNREVKRLAVAGGEEQRVDVTGRVNDGVITSLERPPTVDVSLALQPTDAAPSCRGSLFFNGAGDPVVDGAGEWPLQASVAAGLYTLRVDTEAPFKAIAGQPLNIAPPIHQADVSVS